MDNEQQTPSRIEELRGLTFGFDEHPLEHFRTMSASEIEAHPGIGPKFRERIQKALAELAELTGEEYTPPPDRPAGAGRPDEYLEPAAPGTGGPLVVLVVIALALIVAAAMYFARGQGMTDEQKAELETAQAARLTASEALLRIDVDATEEALAHVTTVFQKAEEGNFGEARQYLRYVAASLAAIKTSQALAAAGARRARVTAAETAVAKAAAALRLTDPLTHEQVMAAVDSAVKAVSALKAEEVKD